MDREGGTAGFHLLLSQSFNICAAAAGWSGKEAARLSGCKDNGSALKLINFISPATQEEVARI